MNELINKAKMEVNLILASITDETDKKIAEDKYKVLINLCKVLDDSYIFDSEKYDLIRDFNELLNTGLLSPLTLQDDEFTITNAQDGLANYRYPHIYKKDGMIYNQFAFDCLIRANYNDITKEEIPCTPYLQSINRIYISKGGIITGEYIEDCIIKQEIVNKHQFDVKSPIVIPVSMIYDIADYIVVVDHREPKLKDLKEFYDVPIKIDEIVKSRKYNIRNYKKLNK